MNDPELILGVAAAAVGGLAVGTEREWSGHASGATAHFAGVRTFTLLGGFAGIAGWLWTRGIGAPAAVLLGGMALLIVAAYVASSRRDVEATTEVAAFIVLAAGFVAGAGHLAFASGVIAVTVLMLVEKSRLHRLVARLNDAEITAGARFAVMAVVILPLLPSGPYGPFGGIRPQALWALVLLFAGLSFVGYIARRAVGARRGDALAGLLGGLVSSTQVALAHSRASRSAGADVALSLACGAVAASTMLFLRTAIAATILSPELGAALLPYVVPGLIVGTVASVILLRRTPRGRSEPTSASNPLELRSALQMAAIFQVVLTVAYVLRERFGAQGLIATGALVGSTEVDAVTIAMARAVADGTAAAIAAQAVAIGMLANTIVKLGFAVVIGRGRFRAATAGGLLAIGAVVGAALYVLRP